jgi:hypothetical protein
MKFNQTQFNKVVETAKAKAAGNKRWIAAIDKAADALLNGKWIVTELANCLVVTSASEKTYKVTEKICQCSSYFYNRPCAHRAGVRLVNLYNEVADKTTASPRVVRSTESDRTGVKCVVVRCDGWMI